MVKRLFSIVAVAALFSGLAMAQEVSARGFDEGPGPVTVQAGSEGGFLAGPDVMAAQAGRAGGFDGGPRRSSFQVRMMGPMGHGPDMWFHRRGMDSWWMNPEVAERIGLSDQQKQQLEKVSQDSRLKMIELRADLEKQEVILEPMMRAFHPDEAQVLEQVDKVSQARAAIEKSRVQTMLASRAVLTEDQWKKLHEPRPEFHRTFERRGGQRHGGPNMAAPPSSK